MLGQRDNIVFKLLAGMKLTVFLNPTPICYLIIDRGKSIEQKKTLSTIGCGKASK